MSKNNCEAKRCKVGGQAVMEGVMMKSPKGIAMAVRTGDGSIVSEYKPAESKIKKGTFLGTPVIRGVAAFIDSMVTGMKTLTRSAELYGEDISNEEPSKFEKFLAEKLGKSVEDIAIGIGVILAIVLSIFLFFYLPVQGADLILHNDYAQQIAQIESQMQSAPANAAQLSEQLAVLQGKYESMEIWRSLLEGGLRLIVFLGYILFCSLLKDIRRVFMYHGAEHKVISCYEAGDVLTPECAMKHKRLHPRCGTNYLFLVMAISIVIFTALTAVFPINWIENRVLRIIARMAVRILLLPVVAGVSYEVLQAAAKSDNLLCRIVRAPGMALQLITTREPTVDMIEVALCSFKLAMESIGEDVDIPGMEDTESNRETQEQTAQQNGDTQNVQAMTAQGTQNAQSAQVRTAQETQDAQSAQAMTAQEMQDEQMAQTRTAQGTQNVQSAQIQKTSAEQSANNV